MLKKLMIIMFCSLRATLNICKQKKKQKQTYGSLDDHSVQDLSLWIQAVCPSDKS